MKIDDIYNFSKNIKGKIIFDKNVKNLNWFNIGGETKIFFKPENLFELIEFVKIYKNRGKIFTLGAGSNILFTDEVFQGAVIKLGNIFSKISKFDDETIIAGGATLDKNLSEFAKNNNIGGFEFLSCIPGSIGGGIRMNSGCFDKEFKDVLVSVQALDPSGKILTIPSKKINFKYRGTDLKEDMIFLSATFKGFKKEKKLIEKDIRIFKEKKEKAQPSRIKTGGSTFKNPIDQSTKKVWQLIEESVPLNTKFGDAVISQKHCNFFVNKKNATFENMKKLISFVKKKVKDKTGININLEIVVVE